MELFIIQCTTCRARLKVNDESVIGDILACPKCGSMVQVVPPVGWQRMGESATDTDFVATHQETPASKAAAVLPPSLPQRSALQEAGATARPAVLVTAPTSPASTGPAASRTTAFAGSLSTAIFTRVQQDWILLGCGLAAGVVLGASAWLTINWTSGERHVAAASQTVAENSRAELQDEPPSVALPREAERESTDAHAAVATDQLSPASDVIAPADSLITERSPAPSDAAAPPKVAVKTPVETDAASPPRATESRAPGIKLEPVEKSPTPPQAGRDAAASAADPARAAEDPQPPPSPTARPSVESVSSTADTSAPKLTGEEIDERLSGPLPAIKFVDVPLAQFIEFVSNFAGLPITIDDAALAKVGMKRQKPVTVRLKDSTAREALTTAVNSLGLACAVRDGRLIVTAPSK